MSDHADTIRDGIFALNDMPSGEPTSSALDALDALLSEIQQLRDALEDFANPQHWGMTRDYGPERVPVWIGSYHKSPVEIARSALDGTPSAVQTLEDESPTERAEASS